MSPASGVRTGYELLEFAHAAVGVDALQMTIAATGSLRAGLSINSWPNGTLAEDRRGVV